ncbi:glutamate ABC transporter substrate-binding protein [Streptomyces sp. NPDC005438]|uniref:glutamate ABC transporter substrate-binding protein n=1 Tax=Streptomyces sp. NPDC005438 TaxID=3156880 RepID=UPI0033AAB5D5
MPRDGGNARRTGGRRRWLTTGAALAVAAVATAGTLTALPGHDGDGSAPSRERAEPAARPGAVGKVAKAKRETCEDGSNPASSLRPSGASGKAVERIKDKDQLVVGVDQNSYLWGYRNPATGRIEGFDIDLVRAIAEDLLGSDPRIVYKTVPTNKRVEAIQKGQVDMVVRTMTISCDRLKEVAFSTAYFESGQQLVAPKGSDITGVNSSLRGRRLCFAKGSSAETLLTDSDQKYHSLGFRTVRVDNQLDCLVRLQVGRADAVVTDNALGAGQAAQDPSVELVGDPLTLEPYGVAMNLEDKDLVRRVNKVLEAYREGGSKSDWRASYDKWLAERMDLKEPAPPSPSYKD